MDLRKKQMEICARFDSRFLPSKHNEKVGIALNTIKYLPLNALRLTPENDTSGWYIWGGDSIPTSDDFFKPLHITHLESYTPELMPYLALEVGWRVLLANDYEDVWFDESLI